MDRLMPEGGQCPDFSLELDAMGAGAWPCAGVDEAGRGPLAGPVVAAAVILDPGNIPQGLDDSKRLSAAWRDCLFGKIVETAVSISLSAQSAESIDDSDIRKAALIAMAHAVRSLAIRPGFALIDGRDVPENLPCKARAVVKGDGRSQSIAAASIVAKVLRDRMMACAGNSYPAYGLENHAGYGTAAHRAAIWKHGGVKRLHRFSFSPLKTKRAGRTG